MKDKRQMNPDMPKESKKISLSHYQGTLQETDALKDIYLEAFPANEQAPFSILIENAKKGRGDFLLAYDGESLAGFAYLICHKDLAYLFYLAVRKDLRNQGYGTAILEQLKQVFAGKRLFLALEQLDSNSKNYPQRVRRHAFYERCGFKPLSHRIKEVSVVFDGMGIGGDVAPKEYKALMQQYMGRLRMWLLGIRML